MSVYQIELLLYFNQIAPKNTKKATTKKYHCGFLIK